MNNGYWWCGRCKEELPGAKVTFQERCEDCGNHVDWFDMAESPIEHIGKLEALARELVAALKGVSGMLDYATGECRCGVCEYCNVQKRADKALTKAKEVLGDE